jgi:hypothetical protein
MIREFRIIAKAHIRAKAGEKPGIEGYAAVFNELSEDLGSSWFSFREMVMPGAFTACLATKPDVRCLMNHNPDVVLGRTTARTLSLAEDNTGLHFDCDTPDTQAARDLLTSIGRGDISQCSFGFIVRKEKWGEEKDEDGNVTLYTRELHAVDVFDVSPVTFPAYPQTSVDQRALWPDGRPRSVRLFATVLGRGQQRQDDEEENANGCECDCTACEDDNCMGCSNVACDDGECADHDCPMQDDGETEENSRALEVLRMRARVAAAVA